MPQLRKYILILLIVLTGLPYLLSIGISLYQQWIRHQMLEKMELQELHTLIIKQQDLHWEVEGQELKIDDRMFDVKSIQVEGDMVFVLGLFDDEETKLFQKTEAWQKDSENEEILLGLGQLFHNWQAEKQHNLIFIRTEKIIFGNHAIYGDKLPPLPEKKGLIHPPDYMEC